MRASISSTFCCPGVVHVRSVVATYCECMSDSYRLQWRSMGSRSSLDSVIWSRSAARTLVPSSSTSCRAFLELSSDFTSSSIDCTYCWYSSPSMRSCRKWSSSATSACHTMSVSCLYCPLASSNMLLPHGRPKKLPRR